MNSYFQGSPNSQRLSNSSESDSDKTVCEPTEEHTNKAFSDNKYSFEFFVHRNAFFRRCKKIYFD